MKDFCVVFVSSSTFVKLAVNIRLNALKCYTTRWLGDHSI